MNEEQVYNGIIFDLDQTLVNSQVADPFRRSRQWSRVYELIPSFQVYSGITAILNEFYRKEIPMCIVSSAPGSYCRRVIEHFQWPINKMVSYHDSLSHKPYPEPIQRGVELLGLPVNQVVSAGDSANDVAAARAAGVVVIGTLWGSLEEKALIDSAPDYLCRTVSDLQQLIEEVMWK